MIENLNELTDEQKNDLQEFVSIANKNIDLWWADKSKNINRFLYLEGYFGDIIDIESLNEFLIYFPDKQTNKILQLLSEDQCARKVGQRRQPGLIADRVYAFRFEKNEDVVYKKETQKIQDPSAFNTKQLLFELQNVLMELKTGEFKGNPPWEEGYF